MRKCNNPECGKPLVRKKRWDGTPERKHVFKRRKYCDTDCYNTMPRKAASVTHSVLNEEQKKHMDALLAWR